MSIFNKRVHAVKPLLQYYYCTLEAAVSLIISNVLNWFVWKKKIKKIKNKEIENT